MAAKKPSGPTLQTIEKIAHQSSTDANTKSLAKAIAEIIPYVNSMQAEITQIKKDLKRSNRRG